MLEFGLLLAAVIFAVTGVLTPLLDRAALPARWPAPTALVVAAALSIAPIGQGDEQSGAFALPAPAARATAAATMSPASPSWSARARR